MPPVCASDTSWRCGSTNHGESFVLRNGQMLFSRPLDRNWGGGQDNGGDKGRADYDRFTHNRFLAVGPLSQSKQSQQADERGVN